MSELDFETDMHVDMPPKSKRKINIKMGKIINMSDNDLDKRIAMTLAGTDVVKNWIWKRGDKWVSIANKFRIIFTVGDCENVDKFRKSKDIIPIPNLEQMLDLIEVKGWTPILHPLCFQQKYMCEIRYVGDPIDKDTWESIEYKAKTRREAVWKALCYVYGLKGQGK